jgi:hypothetical protein
LSHDAARSFAFVVIVVIIPARPFAPPWTVVVILIVFVARARLLERLLAIILTGRLDRAGLRRGRRFRRGDQFTLNRHGTFALTFGTADACACVLVLNLELLTALALELDGHDGISGRIKVWEFGCMLTVNLTQSNEILLYEGTRYRLRMIT